ncbi:hypothetical protein BpHYR1_024514 [Brachionus plicatilis]|uniref:Uncharacterized protein n=1 Tax=Brachionus plicatilis TaxID=10195 RepID=A0A3M7QKG4_BRAPC|nr:hypothetical protein BpHYR1_024514 [Brachionus plicatilis]
MFNKFTRIGQVKPVSLAARILDCQAEPKKGDKIARKIQLDSKKTRPRLTRKTRVFARFIIKPVSLAARILDCRAEKKRVKFIIFNSNKLNV